MPTFVGGPCVGGGVVAGSVGGAVVGSVAGSVGAGGFMIGGCDGGGALDEQAAASVTTNGVANDRRGIRAGIAAL
jgi:hypothetical protein